MSGPSAGLFAQPLFQGLPKLPTADGSSNIDDGGVAAMGTDAANSLGVGGATGLFFTPLTAGAVGVEDDVGGGRLHPGGSDPAAIKSSSSNHPISASFGGVPVVPGRLYNPLLFGTASADGSGGAVQHHHQLSD